MDPTSESHNRLVLFPIKYDNIWELYKKQCAVSWFAEELDLGRDAHDYADKLKEPEQKMLLTILAFFANSDAQVMENIFRRFYSDVQVPEMIAFLTAQNFIEQIHHESYNLMISTLERDTAKRELLFSGIKNVPCVRKKGDWINKWMSTDMPYGNRLLAFVCIEGIFFSSAFACIFYFRKRGLLPGLRQANEMISRDEALHTQFGCEVFKMLSDDIRPDRDEMLTLIRDAVKIEHEFVREAIDCPLLGLNSDTMCAYVEFVADKIWDLLGMDGKVFGTPNPFDWMESISLNGKTNFFESRNSDYNRASVVAGSTAFSVDEDF